MIVIGIDPGLSGAIARIDTASRSVRIEDVPTFELMRGGKKKRDIDAHSLARVVDDMAKEPGTRFIIEQVGAMPGQGTSSMFAFGKAYGLLIGVAASTFCPIDFVTPAVWKKAMGVTASKDGSRARASQLYPEHSAIWSRVKDDGRAESLLIATYAIRKENEQF